MTEAFYVPDPGVSRNPDADSLYTGYATRLEKAGLAERFPPEAEVRRIAIEVLAEREAIEDVEQDLALIDEAVAEARVILATEPT